VAWAAEAAEAPRLRLKLDEMIRRAIAAIFEDELLATFWRQRTVAEQENHQFVELECIATSDTMYVRLLTWMSISPSHDSAALREWGIPQTLWPIKC